MFRYGVQVNSLGLTEPQPENNVYRILIEALAVTLSKRARCRALQLPAWNEALGLPRPWDQQWSLRLQQILAYETDLLEYEDLFDGSRCRDRQDRGAKRSGARDAGEAGCVRRHDRQYRVHERSWSRASVRASRRSRPGGRSSLASTATRRRRPRRCPGGDGSIMATDHGAESRQIAKLKAWRAQRNR